MSGTSADVNHTPFDFILKTLDYSTSDGYVIDLRLIMTELNIFEDLFSNVMNGNLSVTDSTNIFGHLVLQGNEFLHVVFDKPGLNLPIDKTFRIYGKPDVTFTKPQNQVVTLAFCSEELLLSKGITFSKSYSNILISDIVKDIAANVLKIPAINFPTTNIEPTKGITNLTVPYYNPMQALNWLSAKAISNYVGASYLFYENKTGFNFRSTQSLMDVTQSVATYNYNIKNVQSDPNTDFFDASAYQIISTPDSLHSIMSGKNSGQLMTLDLLRQQFTTKYFNSDDLYNSSVTLGSGKTYNNFPNRLGHTQADSYGSYRKFYLTNIGQNQSSYITGKQVIQPTNVESSLVERNAQLLQLMGMRIKMVVPGNPGVKVGDVITFNVPSIEPQSGSMEGTAQRILDPYMTGLYLITALRHRIIPQTYETILELSRDSLNQKMPDAVSSSQAYS